VDDILVWDATIEEHDENLCMVLLHIEEANRALNKEKGGFWETKIKFLGHIAKEGKYSPIRIK